MEDKISKGDTERCPKMGSLVQKGISCGLSKYSPSTSNIKQFSSALSLSTGRSELWPAGRPPVSTVTPNPGFLPAVGCINRGWLLKASLPCYNSSRTVVRYSLRKGKRKSVGPVVRRFFRLDWGVWIRTRAGRNRKVWRKTARKKLTRKYHVFCNKTQSRMLDKMVTGFWKRKKHYVDDPYQPYQKRTGMDHHFSENSKPQWYP